MCVQCPWHGSWFDMRDGRTVRGPATVPQPAYETRIRDGNVEVHRRARGSLRMPPDGTVDNDILAIEHRLNLHRRQITPEQFRKFEGHVAEIFSTFGLEPHGVAVYLQAQHMCTQMRGVREVEPLTRTTFWRGVYDTTTGLRQEFLEISRWRPVPS